MSVETRNTHPQVFFTLEGNPALQLTRDPLWYEATFNGFVPQPNSDAVNHSVTIVGSSDEKNQGLADGQTISLRPTVRLIFSLPESVL